MLLRKMSLNMSPTIHTLDIRKTGNQRSGLLDITRFNQETCPTMLNYLRECTTFKRNHGRTGRHSLNGSQAKGFIPHNREEQCTYFSHQFPERSMIELA
jgi:hypothetical protein